MVIPVSMLTIATIVHRTTIGPQYTRKLSTRISEVEIILVVLLDQHLDHDLDLT